MKSVLTGGPFSTTSKLRNADCNEYAQDGQCQFDTMREVKRPPSQNADLQMCVYQPSTRFPVVDEPGSVSAKERTKSTETGEELPCTNVACQDITAVARDEKRTTQDEAKMTDHITPTYSEESQTYSEESPTYSEESPTYSEESRTQPKPDAADGDANRMFTGTNNQSHVETKNGRGMCGDEAGNEEGCCPKDDRLEATADHATETDRLEATADHATETDRLEATADQATETDRLEATADHATKSDRLEATADHATETDKLEATADHATERDRLEATADHATESDRLEATADHATESDRLEATADQATESDRLEATADHATERGTRKDSQVASEVDRDSSKRRGQDVEGHRSHLSVKDTNISSGARQGKKSRGKKIIITVDGTTYFMSKKRWSFLHKQR